MKHPYLTVFFLIAIALPVLVLVIVAPMSAHNQFIFGLSMIGACLIAHFCSKRHFVSFMYHDGSSGLLNSLYVLPYNSDFSLPIMD